MTYYTIPPSHSFLEVIAQKLLDETADDPLKITQYHVYVPTRRAQNKLAEALAQHRPKTFLPTLISLTSLDKEALAFSHIDIMKKVTQLSSILSKPRRRFLLMTLLKAFTKSKEETRNPLSIARSLEELLDELQDEGIPIEALHSLETGFESRHIETSVDFLKLFSSLWPQVLKDETVLSSQGHRRTLMSLQEKAWRLSPPTHPVWVVGASGSLPDVRDFMAAVGRLKTGAVFLPGYDPTLSGDISLYHPLASQHRFVEEKNINRKTIQVLPNAFTEKDHLLYTILQPTVQSTAASKTFFNSLSCLTANRLDEEAACIALYLREFLERSQGQALVVTQSRPLAKSIVAQLKQWSVHVDDSAGSPLPETAIGSFIQETCHVFTQKECPWVPLLALLKHPFFWHALDRGSYLKQLRYLEKNLFRRITLPTNWQKAEEVLTTFFEKQEPSPFSVAFQEFFKTLFQSRVSLKEAPSLTQSVHHHEQLMEACVGAPLNTLPDLEEAWMEIKESLTSDLPLSKAPYGEMLSAIVSTLLSKPKPADYTPRIQLLGVLESRLLRPDLLIFAGLNEDVWPSKKQEDPWLNKAMRKKIGLPPQEQKLGFAAHDFMNILACKEVLLTTLQEGTLMRPSVFWRLLHLSAKKQGITLKEHTHLLKWVQEKRMPQQSYTPLPPPKGSAPRNKLPSMVSISNATIWFNNPYVFYAKCVLNLSPLRPITPLAEEIQFGLMVHWVLNQLFVQKLTGQGFSQEIRALLERALYRYMHQAIALPFWKKRAETILKWCLHEIEKAGPSVQSVTEITGTMPVTGEQDQITLKGIADRIDITEEGLTILDYKTSQLPTQKAVSLHLAPQLSLEAALYYYGSFAQLKPNADVISLCYWRLLGKEKAGEIMTLKDTPKKLAQEARDYLSSLVKKHYEQKEPFEATPQSIDEAYDHLMRLDHWTGGTR